LSKIFKLKIELGQIFEAEALYKYNLKNPQTIGLVINLEIEFLPDVYKTNLSEKNANKAKHDCEIVQILFRPMLLEEQ
jgi:hypothetical protein